MVTTTSKAGDAGTSFNSARRAQGLWAFLRKPFPTLTLTDAQDILKELAPADSDSARPLASRLRQVLMRRRLHIKHTAALHAATLVLQGAGWFESRQGALLHTLKLLDLSGQEENLTDWGHAAAKLVEVSGAWMERNPGVVAFQLSCNPVALVLASLDLSARDKNRDWPATPIAVINPLRHDDHWMRGAGCALEHLRRYLEETKTAMLNGATILQCCDRSVPSFLGGSPITAADALNTELVLMREDSADFPEQSFEIVRGDELVCWAQFDKALDDFKERPVSILVDDDGGWVCGNARFAWQLVTLKPQDFVPGLATRNVAVRESKQLLRRYRIAKLVLGRELPWRRGGRQLHYLDGQVSVCRVNLHQLGRALKDADLSWEGYCSEIGQPGRQLTPELPLEIVLPLVERLALAEPNSIFARPSRSQLTYGGSDEVMRALLPRVNHVRYRTCPGLSSETQEALREAVSELSTSILLRHGAFIVEEDPLPDMVYTSDGEEFVAKLEKLGLTAYVGVMPHFMKIPPDAKIPPDSWPYAFGRSLFLDIDVQEA